MRHLAFFVRQALSQMNRNRQRTLFVLFCIAVGVAAVVSLRNLGLMIEDALTGNLQAENRGDMVITTPGALQILSGGGTVDPDMVQSRGPFLPTVFSEEGIRRIQAWAQENGFELLLANRNLLATRLRATDRARTEVVQLYMVQPEGYPFYEEVDFVAPAGVRTDYSAALAAPDALVISERLANALDVGVGDTVAVAAVQQPFRVSAIVADSAEASLTNPNSVLFPFALLSYTAGVELFQTRADTIYVRMPADRDVAAAAGAFAERFEGLGVTTIEDVRALNSTVSETVTKFITIMGLVSLLIGGIGIVNTMNVVVSRRTLEIAVLKTIGLQGRQITFMFLVEALLLGIIGSALGAVTGLGLVSVLQTVVERVFAQPLAFAVYPEAIVLGAVLGVLVTLIFGLLPTISAARVRPSVVLHPTDAIVPRAGRLVSLLIIVAMTAVIGLLVGRILQNYLAAMALAYAALLVLGVAAVALWVLAYVFSRLPSFGNSYLKLAQRAIGAHAGRTASTLLALVIGMFSLSLILLMTRSLVNVVNDALATQMGGNVMVAAETVTAGRTLQARLDELPAVRAYEASIVYSAKVVAVNGERNLEPLREAARRAGRAELFGAEEGEQSGFDAGVGLGESFLGGFDPVAIQLNLFLQGFTMQRRADVAADYQVAEGADVSASEPGLLLQEGSVTHWLGLDVGDTLTFHFGAEGNAGQEVTVPIVGLMPEAEQQAGVTVNTGNEVNAIVADAAIPAGVEPQPPTYIVEVEADHVEETVDRLSQLPGILAFDVSQFSALLNRLFGQLATLPLVVAVLALFASSVIIANAVSLATLERRREIGIMKALGLDTADVLRLLLLENGLVGLLGGLLGTGVGAVFIFLSGVLSDSLGSFPILTLASLVLLAVALTLGATLIAAYGAAREKPLIVLRYE